MTTASTGQCPRVRLSLTRSATERRCTSGRRMARYEPFPSSSLKFRTVGFPQSGFKAGLSDRTFLDVALLKPSTRPSQCCSKFDLSFVRSAADIASRFRAPAYSALHTHRHAPGASAVLLQGSSLWCGVVVSAPSSLNRPHGPHSTTQDNFDAQRLYALSCYCGSLL